MPRIFLPILIGILDFDWQLLLKLGLPIRNELNLTPAFAITRKGNSPDVFTQRDRSSNDILNLDKLDQGLFIRLTLEGLKHM